jgi:hypothetical protein
VARRELITKLRFESRTKGKLRIEQRNLLIWHGMSLDVARRSIEKRFAQHNITMPDGVTMFGLALPDVWCGLATQ